jgi:CRISPR-associated protein Csm4
MKTIKVVIKPKSSFSSLIHSDTLFGAFCWNYLDKYGEEELEKLLENQSIVFSNIFPNGKLPCPIVPNNKGFIEQSKNPLLFKHFEIIKHLFENQDINQELFYFKNSIKSQDVYILSEKGLAKELIKNLKCRLDFTNLDEYADVKKIKKINYLPISSLSEKVSLASIEEAKSKVLKEIEEEKREKKQPILQSQTSIRNSINRNTGTVLEGGLFSAKEFFYREDVLLFFYVMFDEQILAEEKVKEMIMNMGICGIGKDKSIGKGAFDIKEFVEDDLPNSDKKEYFMSLSNGFPDSDCKFLFGKTITKFSKHARESFFLKNPVQMYTEGSVFKVIKKKDFYGSYLDNVSKKIGHKHHGCLFPLYIDFEELKELKGA